MRRQIIERVEALLVAGLPVGSKVYRERVYPLQAPADVPARKIQFSRGNTETSKVTTMPGAGRLERHAFLEIVNAMRGTSDVVANADQMCFEVEEIIGPPFGDPMVPWQRITLIATVLPDPEGSGEQPIAEATMIYDVEYYTRERIPGARG